MAQKVISFHHCNKFLFGGLASHLPEEWGALLLKVGYVMVCWIFLYILYRKKVFLKV
jgi:predicted acyltransferase